MNLKNFAAKVSKSFDFAKSATQILRLINNASLNEPHVLRKSPQKYI